MFVYVDGQTILSAESVGFEKGANGRFGKHYYSSNWFFKEGIYGYGMSKCGPEDVYDYQVGFELARNRAIMKAFDNLSSGQLNVFLESLLHYNTLNI
jgi:hypothetical protein